ncbi:MAG: hypothetical protein J6K61_03590 [Clostridia bacterium]|nr:hypothetical protein [Clostridia bacterium]
MQSSFASRPVALRLASFALALIICLSLFVVFGADTPVSAAASGSESYTEKYVSVVLDDSGSMDEENRWQYATYAMQMLISLLNEQDKLWITTLNKSTFEVDLSNPDRNAVIQNVIQNKLPITPTGGTHREGYDSGLKVLTDNGMKLVDGSAEDSNREYWFFVLSDGAFSDANTETLVSDTVGSGYANLNVVYFSVGSSNGGSKVVDLTQTTNPTLVNSSAFSAFHVSQSRDMLSAVESIANLISGRYSATQTEYAVSGNTVTVDLGVCGFSLRTVSIMLQNTDAVLQSATYNGAPMDISREVTIVPDSKLGMQNGYSAIIAPRDFLSGGQMTLTFSKNVGDSLVLLMEPALRVESVLYYLDGNGQKVETDGQYINSHLTPSNKICVDYRIVEEGTGRVVNPSGAFAVNEARVSYAGSTYAPGQAFPLVIGKNQISLSVTMMNGAYTMYHSIPCLIMANPNYYRVESTQQTTGTGDSKAIEAIFTVYANDMPLTGLAGYTYTVLVKDGSGNTIPVAPSVQNGKIHVILPCGSREYGDYTASVRVLSPDGFAREGEEILSHYPKALTLNVITGSLSLQQYQLTENTDGFSFSLAEGSSPLRFDPSYLNIKVTVGGRDVTSFCTMDGDKLFFVPTEDAMGELAGSPSTYPVQVSVSLRHKPEVSATASASFVLLQTDFHIDGEQKGSPLDRFHISKSGASVQFSVVRDGKAMSKADLEAALANGSLKIKAPDFEGGLASLAVTVEEKNGEAFIVCRPVANLGSFANFFASMFFSASDKPVTLSVGGASQTVVFPVVGFSFLLLLQYILRVAIFLFIIYAVVYIIALIVTYKSVPRLGKKTILAVEFQIDTINRVVMASRKGNPIKIGTKLSEKVMFKRLLPWNLTKGQTREIRVFGIKSTLIAEGTFGAASLALNAGTDHLQTWDCTDSANDMTLTELPAMLMRSSSFNAKSQPTTYYLRHELTGDHTDTTIRQAPLGTLAAPICVCSGSQVQRMGSSIVCRLVFLLN